MEKKRDKFIPVTYAEARSEIERLVEHFARNLDAYKQSAATIPADKYEPSVRLYQRQIEITDRQINALVYELYGLTEEEIEIVAGATR